MEKEKPKEINGEPKTPTKDPKINQITSTPQKSNNPTTPTILPPQTPPTQNLLNNPYFFHLVQQQQQKLQLNNKVSPKIAPSTSSVDKSKSSILYSQKFPLPNESTLIKKRKIETTIDKGCNCKKTGKSKIFFN